ncbi:oligopeptide transporter, OPT family [candidate division KSB1 bacterium]|nr:oligopeptide transporter, OPT family [candidate division KSB1 bacterium]
MAETKPQGLPSNAYTPLKPGEKYMPYVPASKTLPEITVRSVIWGVIMAIVFSFGAAYLGLKIGQVFEAAIPIAILAVGLSRIYKRKNSILENVIIQSIGSASGVVVAGGIFVIPAFYILNLQHEITLFHTFLAAFIGGSIGILFLIPMRRYFVAEQHGLLPFPEATATTEILTSGETGGGQAKTLIFSMLIGGVYDFLADVMHVWNFHLASAYRVVAEGVMHWKSQLFGSVGGYLGEKFRLVWKMDALSAIFGLGYIVGLKYSAIIAAGSVLSFLVLVPAVYFFGQHINVIIPPETETLIKDMTETEIFKIYVQKIGIGAIAMAGILGIIKSSKVIFKSFSIGFKQLLGGHHEMGSERTDKDISMKAMLALVGLFVLLMAVFFIWVSGPKLGLVGLLIVLLLAFLFTTVAAYAIAIVGTNPVSGMTLITLIVTSLVLSAMIPAGEETKGMIIALIMGCVVCTALSMSGAFVSDLKIGYWFGATPQAQQRWKFLGAFVSAISVGLAILIIHNAYGFILADGTSNPNVAAPQGNLMATVIKSLMSDPAGQPWILYGIGALIAIMLEMSGVPPLAFALGMYLPIQLNMPLLAGGFMSWLVIRSSKKEEVSKARRERGTLIASGFIAGGALMGMLGAVLNLDQIGTPARFISIGVPFKPDDAGRLAPDVTQAATYFQEYGQVIAILTFIGLALYLYYSAKQAAKE